MPISLVQSASGFALTPSLTIPISATTAGNFILVSTVAAFGSTIGNVSAVTDTAGNVYTNIGPATGNLALFRLEMWYAKNIIGGATSVHLAISGGGPSVSFTGFVIEYSGADLVNPIDSANLDFEFVGPPYQGASVSASNAGDVLVGAAANNTSINSPWTTLQSSNGNAIGQFFPGSTGSFNPTWNGDSIHAGSHNYCFSNTVAIAPQIIHTLSLFDSTALTDSSVETREIFLSLSDSMTSSDSIIKSTTKRLSDSIIPSDTISLSTNHELVLSDLISVSDSAPQSFSVNSNASAPIQASIMEALTIKLIPSYIKTYFRIQ